jgi:hypothetical protein
VVVVVVAVGEERRRRVQYEERGESKGGLALAVSFRGWFHVIVWNLFSLVATEAYNKI